MSMYEVNTYIKNDFTRLQVFRHRLLSGRRRQRPITRMTRNIELISGRLARRHAAQ